MTFSYPPKRITQTVKARSIGFSFQLASFLKRHAGHNSTCFLVVVPRCFQPAVHDGLTYIFFSYNISYNIKEFSTMTNLKVRKIGNALGVTLPKEILARLHLEEGDRLFLTQSPDGSYRLTPYDPEFEKQMKLGKKIMAKYRNTLRVLAT
jgi:putative addiction module antidote